MLVPECTPPEAANSVIEERTPAITREILQSYLLLRVLTVLDSTLITIIDGSSRTRRQYRWPLPCSLGSGDRFLPSLSQ
jgi:hypothetical protein